jgi:methylmalonyl-CoA mutase, C-terminal domain
MHPTRQCETVNMLLRNMTLWNEGMMEETLQSLSDATKREKSVRKESRIVRILMATLGEGHAEAMMTLTFAFRDAGYEVIYTDIQRPEAIVAAAIQECVDHIGITTLPGANIEDLARVVALLKQEDSSDIGVTAGGYLEPDEIPRVREMGVVEFFPIGTSISELVQWARDNIKPT